MYPKSRPDSKLPCNVAVPFHNLRQMNLISRSIIATCLSFQIGLAEEQPERPPRSVKELVASLEMAGQKIYSEGLRGKDEISYQQKILANWSGPEINLVLNQLEGDRLGGVHYWKEPLIEQSAYLDEEPECIIILGFNSVIGTDLDKSHHASGRYSAEMEVRSYYDYLESVIKGWSRRDPKAAWAAINKPNGRLSRSVLLKEYGHHLCKHIFVHLSKVDHEFALAELFKHPDRLYRRSMLKGMSRGLPSGLDWRKFYESIVKTIKEKKWDPIITLRDRILARWMQDDHKAAIAWFHSKVGEAISLMEVEVYDDENPSKPIGVKKDRVSLRFAIRHWLANDKEGATAWLKDHPEMIEEIL